MPLTDVALVALWCIGPPLVLMAFVCTRQPCRGEAVKLVSVAFLAGVVGAALAFFAFEALARVAIYRPFMDGQLAGSRAMTLFLLVVVGPVEEVVKLAAFTVAFRGRRAPSAPRAAIMLMTATSLGFAAAENWYAMYVTGPDAGRAAIIPFVHMLFSSFVGWGLARSASTRGGRGAVYLGLLLASAYHGLYDVLEFRGGWWHFATLPLVVLLWFFLTRNLRGGERVLPDEAAGLGRDTRIRRS
ncbi:MAG: PrsW family intramembrane metalloprotease [Deltaproteobacteria bacterium]|nr:PrsW family intramembrane metalloprotease [Deltaproteobacteria bacterium]